MLPLAMPCFRSVGENSPLANWRGPNAWRCVIMEASSEASRGYAFGAKKADYSNAFKVRIGKAANLPRVFGILRARAETNDAIRPSAVVANTVS